MQCGTQGKVIHRASVFKLNIERASVSSSRLYTNNMKVIHGSPEYNQILGKSELEGNEKKIEGECDMSSMGKKFEKEKRDKRRKKRKEQENVEYVDRGYWSEPVGVEKRER
ncbi:11714_t:CDS:2 [Funneliformis mosseae]|uniref:11714_t:CDS:1 n=1 Tax=Funneliformis mosseae TaxID=27381 RepID=A0A9N8YUY3_FUNMO|nr:11714_t:CDS:2 [Funneliformis mosseae]